MKKQAKIKIINKFAIEAQSEFTSDEIGNVREYKVRLLDWNNELVYWRQFQKSSADVEIITWKLDSKSRFNRGYVKFFNKILN